jgi:hypothetical protein
MCVRKFEENENKKKVNKQSLLEICGFEKRRRRKGLVN